MQFFIFFFKRHYFTQINYDIIIYILELSRQILQEVVCIHNLPMQPTSNLYTEQIALVVVSVYTDKMTCIHMCTAAFKHIDLCRVAEPKHSQKQHSSVGTCSFII